jgi:hypothetical protein
VLALAKRGANSRAEDAEGQSVATLAPKLVSVLQSIREGDDGRGLHSSTSQPNLSHLSST